MIIIIKKKYDKCVKISYCTNSGGLLFNSFYDSGCQPFFHRGISTEQKDFAGHPIFFIETWFF